jgi:hypothetical protein
VISITRGFPLWPEKSVLGSPWPTPFQLHFQTQLELQRDPEQLRAARLPGGLSLAVGVVIRLGKTTALRHGILGHPVRLCRIGCAVSLPSPSPHFHLRLSSKPAAPTFLGGYERILIFFCGIRRWSAVVRSTFP